jgi:hypothetical protein
VHDPRVTAAAASLRERGHAILPALVPAPQVERMRALMHAAVAAIDPPGLHASPPQMLAPDLQLSDTGLVFHELLGRVPALQRDLLHPTAHALLREVLGEAMYLEFVGAVVCDASRPFFKWHHHVGGIDDDLARREGRLPAGEPPERVAMLIYLDELGPGAGQLRIDPARRRGPSPHPETQRDWPEQVEVVGPPGTAVFLDQVTWHSVTVREQPGLRTFVGLWFTAPDAPLAELVDGSLERLEDPDPSLAAVLANRPRRPASDAPEEHA